MTKAEALRQVGYTTPNSNWRNFYLTAARELDGTLDQSLRISLDAPDQIAAMPAPALLEGLRVRVDPSTCADATESIGFKVSDTGQEVGLIIRRGVVEPLEAIPGDAALVVEAPKMIITAMVFRGLYSMLSRAVSDGHARLSQGSLGDAERIFGYFDAPNAEPIHLANR
jgi:alkyl sulfatase BDS1-like metallo-beta-lactamase superfamily hydrolase